MKNTCYLACVRLCEVTMLMSQPVSIPSFLPEIKEESDDGADGLETRPRWELSPDVETCEVESPSRNVEVTISPPPAFKTDVQFIDRHSLKPAHRSLHVYTSNLKSLKHSSSLVSLASTGGSSAALSLKVWHKALKRYRLMGMALTLYRGARCDVDPVHLIRDIFKVIRSVPASSTTARA